jgi:hypothetical protein
MTCMNRIYWAAVLKHKILLHIWYDISASLDRLQYVIKKHEQTSINSENDTAAPGSRNLLFNAVRIPRRTCPQFAIDDLSFE